MQLTRSGDGNTGTGGAPVRILQLVQGAVMRFNKTGVAMGDGIED